MTLPKKTEIARPGGVHCVVAVLISAAIFFSTTTVGIQLRSSEFYSKSRLIGLIVRQDEVDITDMAGNKQNIDMMLKFVGALTSAYINFEMIPVGEVGTFVAVFESIPSGVTIDRFEYHRKNLTITGNAETAEDYEGFMQALQGTDYFESVSGHSYLSTDGTTRFELECKSQSTAVNLDF